MVTLYMLVRSTDSLLDENRSLDALFEQMLSERLSSSHAEDANQQEIINIIQENTVATNAGSRERSNDTDFMSSSEQQQPVVGGTQSSDSVPKLTDGEWRGKLTFMVEVVSTYPTCYACRCINNRLSE